MKRFLDQMNTSGFAAIKEMAVGTEFSLDDILPNAKTVWGRFLFEMADKHLIPNIVPAYKKNSNRANLFVRV